jgi:hypothetical protein
METMPPGMLRRAEWGLEKPKFEMSVEEYEVMTPLETEIWGWVSGGVDHSGVGGGSYQDCQDDHEPDLDVHEDLEDVGQLEVVVLDTGLVNGDVLQEGDLLGLGEELGLHGRIG